MPVGEAYDRVVGMSVSGAIVIGSLLVFASDVMGNDIGIRTQLDTSERHACPRECMPHSVGSDERIDETGWLCGNQESCHCQRS